MAQSTPAKAQLYWYPYDGFGAPSYYRVMPRVIRHRAAKTKAAKLKTAKVLESVGKEPFGPIPSGPLQIVISVDQQQLHLYANGEHVADTLVATGVPAHPTPLGIFSVIDKQRYHESNIYSGAPMPYMQRITWSGVAMHQGVGVGRPASHGCIRMPEAFAAKLWVLRSMGARVVIARPELMPQEVADARLFMHKERPLTPPPVASATAGETVKTAESVDSNKTSDVAVAEPAVAAAADRAAVQPAVLAGATVRKTIDPAAATADRAEVVPAIDAIPMPQPKPADLVRGATGAPIAIFISRKASRIYVRQRYVPLFDAPVTIVHPEQPLGTHVFTALRYQPDGSTFRWNVISLPGERMRSVVRNRDIDSRGRQVVRAIYREERAAAALTIDGPPPQTPKQALARIEIPQDVVDRISELMVAGSSLIISDQGLGSETGTGTDFIVVTR
jgi:hypothetical protein